MLSFNHYEFVSISQPTHSHKAEHTFSQSSALKELAILFSTTPLKTTVGVT